MLKENSAQKPINKYNLYGGQLPVELLQAVAAFATSS